jgi:hypothetical protein
MYKFRGGERGDEKKNACKMSEGLLKILSLMNIIKKGKDYEKYPTE